MVYLVKVKLNSDSFPTDRLYPFNIPVIRKSPELTFRKPLAFFVGENGSGKTTLLEAIAHKSGIHVWEKPRRHLAHNNPYENRLTDYVTTVWANGTRTGSLFRAETFRELADFLDDLALCDPGRLHYHGGRILNTLSHGESILSYCSNRLRVKGLYFLDEPEAALSPSSQVKFLNVLRRLETEGQTQLIIATHSPILLAYPGAQIFSFDSPCIHEVAYQETGHYNLYRRFLTDPAAFMEG